TRQPCSMNGRAVRPVGGPAITGVLRQNRSTRNAAKPAPHAPDPASKARPRKCQRASLACVRPFTECTGGVMTIDCGRCEMRGTGCQDCVITVLGPRNAAGLSSAVAPAHLGEAEVKALG